MLKENINFNFIILSYFLGGNTGRKIKRLTICTVGSAEGEHRFEIMSGKLNCIVFILHHVTPVL